jgi:hypothetical protein
VNYTLDQLYTFAVEAGYDKEAATILTGVLALPTDEEGVSYDRVILALLLAQNKEACSAAFKLFSFLRDINPPSSLA